MWKKGMAAVISVCLIFLTACAGGSSGIEEPVPESMNEGGVSVSLQKEMESEELTGELTLMLWLSYAGNVWQPIADAFMEEHPGVTINIDVPSPEEDQDEAFLRKYATRIMTGDGFDIADPSLTGMEKYGAELGLFVNLYEFMDADEEFDRDDYFSCIFEPMERDGKLFELVYSVEPAYVWLNKKLLEQAGLEYTKETISFHEMYELYEKVRETAGEKIYLLDSEYGYEAMSNYENSYFIRNDLMDSEEYVEYLQMRHELYYTPKYRTSWGGGMLGIAEDALCRDKGFPGLSDSIAMDNAFSETEDMTKALLYEGMHGEHYFYTSSSLVISSFSQNKELAWEFLKFVVGEREPAPTEPNVISPNKEKTVSMCGRLNPETKERLFRDIEATDTMVFWDSNLYLELASVYEDYFVNNAITAKECGEKLANRVYLYKNE